MTGAEALRKSARLERRNSRFLPAFSAYNKLRHATGELDAETARVLFEVLVRRRRYRSARRLYDFSAANGFADAHPYANAAETALHERDAELCARILDGVPADSRDNARYQQYVAVLRQLEAERRNPGSMDGVRHIAIGGVSFVGSTIFGVLLGSVPGTVFASETHWLFNLGYVLPDGRRATVANTDTPEDKWPRACRVCGRVCEAFSTEFRRELATMETGRYAAIARRLGTPILITSDKTFTHYWMEDPLFRFDLVLLFKPLRSQIWSALKKRGKDGGTVEGPEAEEFVAGWLDRWTRLYSAMIGFVRPQGRHIVVNWDDFCHTPEQHLQQLVRMLDLPPADDLLNNIRLTHLIGGNTGVDIKGMLATRRAEIRKPEEPRLAPAIEALIAADREANRYERILQRRYRHAFGLD